MKKERVGSPRGTRDQNAGTVATENPGGGSPGDRYEVGDAHSSRRDPPHVTENDREGEQGEAPSLPANASGQDAVPSREQDFEVDEESAYDRRPTQDKDRPASGSV